MGRPFAVVRAACVRVRGSEHSCSRLTMTTLATVTLRCDPGLVPGEPRRGRSRLILTTLACGERLRCLFLDLAPRHPGMGGGGRGLHGEQQPANLSPDGAPLAAAAAMLERIAIAGLSAAAAGRGGRLPPLCLAWRSREGGEGDGRRKAPPARPSAWLGPRRCSARA